MAARLVDETPDVVLRVPVALDELPIPLGFLERIEVLALIFSISAISAVAESSMSRTIAGMLCRRARCAARHRRSPAMIR